ncbi:MAG: restriction endonuclease subunit M [Sulfurimonas sp.]|nr:MAG: restriction endonuclease subunit M [Sulfurimonas sp.]
MFQKSLLKNFIKSFNIQNYSDILKLTTKDTFIAEDANGAEFITLLSKMLNWNNCIREVKNDTDMKKADGVVYDKNKNPIAIIELKSSDKKISNRDIIAQAFRYKNEKPTCKYVIISNFKQLDIYSDSSDVCFSLDMTKSESYTTLYALLSQSSLELNEIARLKKLSKSQDEITKEVYKEYSSFRLKLLNNLIENNQELSKEHIFECANKLLDRFMFILFAEDRGLIPANSIDTVIKQYESSQEWGDGTPLYNYYKKYFHFIDIGNSKVNIPKYNGNLFKFDVELENIIIDDFCLKDDLSHLSAYDFSDDVDVEVLGHIFEQSLNDLEKIKESLFEEHKVVNTRKKDGVFYTPKFITEYIINNTVAKLCDDKKENLKLFNEVKDTKKSKEKRRDDLHTYREFLENLKIVDPACGSGAFLTASFRYLLNEHKWIQKELFKYEAGLFDYHDIDKQIIEKNLFGVDINNASVGIAKLSLWLQTAKRDRPLSNLMGNIKCANSLLSDWNELFPEIMANGGFDCVIGNPPYFNIQILGAKSEVAKEIQETFPHIWQDKSDILFYFIAKAIEITKSKVGFITSNAFLHSAKAVKLRNFILENAPISKIVNFEKYMVFEDASITSAIIEFDKNKKDSECFAYSFKDKNYGVNDINNTISDLKNYFEVRFKKDTVFALVDKKVSAINDKIDNTYSKLNSIFKIGKGMETAANKQFIFKKYPSDFPKEFIKKRMSGDIIRKYEIDTLKEYILYFENIENFEDLPLSIQNHLLENIDFLENRATVKNEGRVWWRYSRPMHKKFYNLNKIWCSYRAKENIFCFDDTKEYIGLTNTTVIFDTNDDLDLKYLLALLNSKTLNFRYKSIGKQTGSGVYEYFENGVGKLPIPNIPKKEQEPFINLVNIIIESKEKIAKYNKHFDSLNAVDKIEIKEEIEKLESLVKESVDEIDGLVYGLYGLSGDEIRIVGGGE